jgi:hypothetical protein
MMDVIMAIAFASWCLFSMWRAEQRYRHGIAEGRKRERRDAASARRGVILVAEAAMLEAKRNEQDVEAMDDKDSLAHQMRVDTYVRKLIRGDGNDG